MLTHISIWYFIVKLTLAQINGEFWWLHDRLADYNGVRPPPPKFENVSESENDDNVKIVFRDDNLITNSVAVTKNSIKDLSNVGQGNKSLAEDATVKYEHLKGHAHKPELPDRLVFKFPEDHFVWKDHYNPNKTKLPVIDNGIEGSSDFQKDNVSLDINQNKYENICSFMKRTECYRNNGLVHQLKYVKKIYINRKLVCCVFPLPSKHEYASSNIHFPNEPRDTYTRRKRSNNEHDLKQRNIILQRRRTHSTRQGTTQRIATPDYEDDDPYWNIKTIKNSNKQVTKKHDYSADDYQEEYASEIPRPGLTGLYSDTKPNWSSQNEKKYGEYSGEYDEVDDDDDDTGTFGYSNVDPRRVTDSKSKSKGKPIRLTTTSEEISYNAESQMISYQSKPNFNVFQDFKLLLKNKGRPKVQRRSTTVDSIIYDSEDSLANEEIDESSDFDNVDTQVYQGCGKVFLSKLNKQDKQIGETVNGSHPWLALVVPTRKRTSFLCYATLIHSKAAITVARCVYRKSPGEISVLTGVWDLNEIPRASSRAVTIRVHSKYRHGVLTHNLAMLHWKRPLETSVNVQPACLAAPHFGDECMFFGWGGFDQAMKRRPRWQRVSIHSCTGSLSFINGKSLPGDAFCATVVSRNTVTGVGGSVMCNTDGGLSAVGVAVSRDSTLALLPIHQWARAAITALNK